MNGLLNQIIESLFNGDNNMIMDVDIISTLNNLAADYISGKETNKEMLRNLIHICNMVWGSNDEGWSPISDAIYDRLMVIAKKIDPENYQVGGLYIRNISFNEKTDRNIWKWSFNDPTSVFKWLKPDNSVGNQMFPEVKKRSYLDYLSRDNFRRAKGNFNEDFVMSKRVRDTSHGNLDLVGTLTKYKYVMTSKASDAGALNDQSCFILERDYFSKLIYEGKLDPHRVYNVLLSIKYDGMSIEGDIRDGYLVGARSRGDTGEDKATDLTDIFKGIRYPRAIGVDADIKYEAIITNENLKKLNMETGRAYKNARNAIAGIMSRLDAPKYRKYITLVPLQAIYHGYTNIPRHIEAELNNKYFCTDVPFNHIQITGNYQSLLFQIDQYTTFLNDLQNNPDSPFNFIYDGIVFEFIDEDIRESLGRTNFVNNFAGAVKFDVEKQPSIFIGYRYEVGMDGTITPVGKFQPVEFMGKTVDEASCYSLSYFNEMNLAVGDMVMVLHVNGVIPRIERIDSEYNDMNHQKNGVIKFPEFCPVCGSRLIPSATGKSIVCVNDTCSGRVYSRMASTCSKMQMKGIGYNTIEKLGIEHLSDFYNLPEEYYMEAGMGEKETENILNILKELKDKRTIDWWLLGNLGFTHIAQSKFKKIIEEIPLDELINLLEDPANELETLRRLCTIPTIGMETAKTIWGEYPVFKDDIIFIRDNFNIGYTQGKDLRPKAVFTGLRDEQLSKLLENHGYNADLNNKFNNQTRLVIVPDRSYVSSTVNKAKTKGVQIYTKEEAYNHFS